MVKMINVPIHAFNELGRIHTSGDFHDNPIRMVSMSEDAYNKEFKKQTKRSLMVEVELRKQAAKDLKKLKKKQVKQVKHFSSNAEKMAYVRSFIGKKK